MDSYELDGSASFDPDAGTGDSIVSWEWDLNGDSIFDVSAVTAVTTVPWATLNALGLEAGSYPVSLRVTDTFDADDVAVTQLEIHESYVVSTINDSGAGSLRQAILDANAHPGPNRIAFNIAGNGPHTISPASALPTITDPLIIDGTTEPDYTGTPVIEIDGANAPGTSGLVIEAGNSTVRGLAIHSFAATGGNGGSGIEVSVNGGNVIAGNYLGTDAAQSSGLGNSRFGIEIRSTGNTAGGATASEKNVVTGNSAGGILVAGAGPADVATAETRTDGGILINGNQLFAGTNQSLHTTTFDGLTFVTGGSEDNILVGAAPAVEITTADGRGADAYIRGGSFANANFGSGNLISKQSSLEYSRKSYIRFDLSSIDSPVVDAQLDLSVVHLHTGGAGNYSVYGLNDGSSEDWDETSVTWNSAPANDTQSSNGVSADATLLGAITLTAGTPDGSVVSFSGQSLIDFINADTDQQVTLIITGGTGDGLTLAAREHATLGAPKLRLSESQNVISGTSDGVPFESVTFHDISSVSIDTATNDAGSPDDTVTLNSQLVASGLQKLDITTGAGADRFTSHSDTTGVGLTFDGGADQDTHSRTADTDFLLQDLLSLGHAAQISGTSDEKLRSVDVDQQGNIYVAGYFAGTADLDPGPGTFDLTSVGNYDIVVAKYSSDGGFLWAHNFGSTGSDFATDIKVDAAGNVFTTGTFAGATDFDPGPGTTTLSTSGGNDAFLLKLDTDGNLVWVSQFVQGGGARDADLALDASGNIHVTGDFSGSNVDFDDSASNALRTSAGSYDVYAAKFSPAGDLVWVRSIGGTLEEGRGGVAVDNSGSVYVGGEFQGTADFDPHAGTAVRTSQGDKDAFVLKLNSSGDFEWVVTAGDSVSFDNVTALDVDQQGNVVATGVFHGTVDFQPGPGLTTLTATGRDSYVWKLDGNGSLIWIRQLTGDGTESALDIEIDALGNIHSSGLTIGGTTNDFDPGPGSLTIPEGSYVSKLTADGTFLAAVSIAGSATQARGLALDGSDAVVLAGTFSGSIDADPDASETVTLTSTSPDDSYIIRLEPSAALTGLGTDHLIGVDSVELTGSSGDNVFDVTRYSGDVTLTGGAGNDTMLGGPGTSTVSESADVDFTLRDAGELDVAFQITGSLNQRMARIATDATGNHYVTGHFVGTSDFDPGPGTFNLSASSSENDIGVAKYSADGSLAWAVEFGSKAGNDLAGDLVVDDAGNVFVVGSFTGTVDFDPGAGTAHRTASGGPDGFVVKLDGNGNLVWVSHFAQGGSASTGRLTVDDAGSVYVAGAFSGSNVDFDDSGNTAQLTAAGGNDAFVLKLDSAGDFVSVQRVGGTGNDAANGVDLDSSGNLLITGTFEDTVDFDPGAGTENRTNVGGAHSDVYVLKLDSSGAFRWVATAGSSGGFVSAVGGAVDGNDDVVVTGHLEGTADFDPGPGTETLTPTGRDAFVWKLTSDGALDWVSGLTGAGTESAQAIALDASGNIYTVGSSSGGSNDFDPGPDVYAIPNGAYVSKLNARGEFAWAGSVAGSGLARGVAVDPTGGVHAIGSFSGTIDADPGSGVSHLTSGGGDDSFITELDQSLVLSGLGNDVLRSVDLVEVAGGPTAVVSQSVSNGLAGPATFTADSTVDAVLTTDATGFSLQSSGAGTPRVGLAYAGTSAVSGIWSGSGHVTVQGSGRVVLAGLSSHSGTTTISSGSVFLNGTTDSPIIVGSSGTLGGSGTTTGSVTIESGGTIAPGNSPGITHTGSFDLNSGATLNVELGGLDTNPGVDYDQVNVTGTVILAGILNVIPYGTTQPGQQYVIINNDSTDAVSGTFAGLAEASTFVIGSQAFQITYRGGDGNDVILESLHAIHTVTNTADSGAGSFRQALLNANGSPGKDLIRFDIAGAGPQTIEPKAPLPDVTDPILVDGWTEPDFSGTPVIEVNGRTAGITRLSDGFNSTIATPPGWTDASIGSGVVDNSSPTSVRLSSSSPPGDRSAILKSNTTFDARKGLRLTVTLGPNGSDNSINTSFSIRNSASPTTDWINFYTTSSTSYSGVISQSDGNQSAITQMGSNKTVNVTWEFVLTPTGIEVTSTSGVSYSNTYANLFNNDFSLDTLGSSAVVWMTTYGNSSIEIDQIDVDTFAGVDGLKLAGGSDGSTVRGLAINRFGGDGIDISGSGSHTIQRNFIGTDVTGLLNAGNAGHGIRVVDSPGNVIGAPSASMRNVISGNIGNGLHITGGGSTGNVVQGNFIGTDSTGTTKLATESTVAWWKGDGNSVDSVGGNNGTFVNGATTTAGFVGDAFHLDGVDDYVSVPATSDLDFGTGEFSISAWVRTDITTGADIVANKRDEGGSLDPGFVFGNINPNAGIFNVLQIEDGSGSIKVGNDSYLATVTDGQWHHLVGVRDGSTLYAYLDGVLIGSTAAGNINVNASSDLVIGGFAKGSVPTDSFFEGNIDELAFFRGALTATDVAAIHGSGSRGLGVVSNQGTGIRIDGGAHHNTVGGTTAAERNVISGNDSSGVHLAGATTSDNVVSGNLIGTDVTGTQALGNDHIAVHISGAVNNLIGGTVAGAGNVISASGGGENALQLSGAGATGNVIQGNLIGTDITGTVALGSASGGVEIYGGGSDNLIGGSVPGARNVISGNTGAGVGIYAGSFDNRVEGNFIGTDSTGTVALGNTWVGVRIQDSPDNTIGGATSGTGNVISGNGSAGIYLSGAASTGTVISGNVIGTDVSGTAAVANASQGILVIDTPGVVIGGVTAAERNLISGNTSHGIALNGTGTTAAVVAGNFIGTDVTGAVALGNNSDGVRIAAGADNNLIGTNGDGVDDAAERNIISANQNRGVFITNGGTDANVVAGNHIGTDVTGTQDLGNSGVGIQVNGGSDNVIGTNGSNDGFNVNERNIVAGNDSWAAIAVSGGSTFRTIVAGNYVGVDVTGNTGLENSGSSIAVTGGADDTRVGTDGNGIGDTAERNVFAGNQYGLLVQDVGTERTVLAGNYIGTNAAGDSAIPNGSGLTVRYGPTDTRIGTDGSNDAFNVHERNVISGNTHAGIVVNTVNWNGVMPAGGAKTDGTIIAGNYIGLNAAGTATLGNGGPGINVAQHVGSVQIGTDGDGIADDAERNVISGNSRGVEVYGWTRMNLTVVDQFLSGDIPTTTETSQIDQVDLRDQTNGSAGDWTENYPVPGDAGDFYAVRVTGTLNVATAGDYSFATGSDNGARLRIGGHDVVVYDVGNQSFANRYGTITLSAGTHAFEFVGYEQGGAAGFEVSVAVGSGITGPVTEANGWRVLGAANAHSEISLSGSADVTAYYPGPEPADITIAGNFIGTDPAGTSDWGNDLEGVFVAYRATGVTVGGTSAGDRNIISGNNRHGVYLASPGTSNNTVLGNFIGTDVTGTVGLGNTHQGVRIQNAPDNVIGGSSAGAGNIIADNRFSGMAIVGTGATGNRIEGNIIGMQADGATSLGNAGEAGVLVIDAVANTIGGSAAGAGNLISGNTGSGVWIRGSQATGNQVAGNLIGTDSNGTAAVANDVYGVQLSDAAHANVIGGSTNGAGNVISGNASHGVASFDAHQNVIAGNRIGTDISGTAALGNNHGIVLTTASTNNTIGGSVAEARNVISGNAGAGISITGAGTNNNVVSGDYIGTNAAGTADLGNTLSGISLSGTSGTRIGTDGDGTNDSGERNVIAGNDGTAGIETWGSTGLIISGNHIGTNAAGTQRLPNSDGISMEGGSSALIGGHLPEQRNLISGNDGSGVVLRGGSTAVRVQGNYIGTNVDGGAALPNGDAGAANAGKGVVLATSSTGNVIGTDGDGVNDAAERNVISGNILDGVVLEGVSSNVVAGNLIGLDVTGRVAIPNTRDGVSVTAGSTANRIGSDGNGVGDSAERNVISGNSGSGILVKSSTTDQTLIAGNFIGTGIGGTVAIPNQSNGIRISTSAQNTTIGGATAALRNVISGNQGAGVALSASVSTTILGNYIGTNVAGSLPVGNDIGVDVRDGSDSTVIGGTATGSGNVISGNRNVGVHLGIGGATNTTVQGNRIGTNATGTGGVGNQKAGMIIDGATNSTIGGTATGAGNVIAANQEGGIVVQGASTTRTVLRGNRIGTNRTSTVVLGNALFGISIADISDTTVGGTVANAGNVVAWNQGPGLWLTDTAAAGSTVQQNSFFSNQGLAIDVGTTGTTLNDPGDADGFLNLPVITAAAVDSGQLTLEGFVGAGRSIELYLNAPAAGQTIGQGRTLVTTLTEGSAADLDNTSDTYGPDVDGVTVATGPVTENRFRFVIPLPAGVDHGTQLTAVALGSISEFGPVVLAGEQASALAPEITVNTTTVTIAAGGSLEVAGSFIDPDSTAWTATIDYGDGRGEQPLSLSPSNTFILSHAYEESGSYTATVRVTDNSLATGTAVINVTVENEAPAVSFNEFTITSPADEGQLVTLTGEFLDAGGDHTVLIEWGDGGTSTVNVPPGGRTFSASHTYLDDSNPAGSATAADVYRVVVTVTDNGGASDSTPLGLFLEEVNNVRPSNLAVSFNSTALTEGDTLELSGLFTDPGVLDVHTVRIDWGDGTGELLTLPVGDRAFSGLSELSHVYPNDRPDGPDTFEVTIELWDDDEPLQPERLTQTITVSNQIPQNVSVTAAPAVIDENGSITLSGSFTDAGVPDAHLVRIIWGDGTPDTVIPLAAGVTSFNNIPHSYRNNNAGGAAWPVRVEVTDYDDPHTPGVGTTDVDVANVSPVLGTITLSSGGAPIQEGETVTVTGSYSDAGPDDRHTVTITWGDGTTSTAVVDSRTKTFSAAHRYVDDPATGTQFTIDVTLTDSDGDDDSEQVFQTVENVPPLIFIEPDENNTDPNFITVNAVVIDPGINDAVDFAWTAFPLVASPPPPQTSTAQSFTIDRTGFTGALWRITLDVTDGDGGVTSFETTLLAGTNADDEITVDSSTAAAAGTADLLILGLGGNDVIDGTDIVDSEISLTMDGGEGIDFLFGGEGDDVYFLQRGDDTANLDSAANQKLPAPKQRNIPLGAPGLARRAGKDRYVLSPNSTLTIADDVGANVLDFTRADFGDGSGIQYDLSLLTTTDFDIQDVYGGTAAGEQNTHFVQALGTFSLLTGSNFSDQLTGASGATVAGGRGDDAFTVKSGTSGATFSGGADDDTLTVSGTGISDLNFGGDDGVNTLVNSGDVAGLTFGGGADDDVLQNLTGGSIGDLNFGGDDGIDTLTNNGTITTLTFGGGSDDDVLTNASGGDISTLNFGGDDGVDSLQNLGSISSLTFGGGADDDTLTNDGTITSLDFTGGADDDVLTNNGTITTELIFGSDDGIDMLNNAGTVGTLTFGGGADDDTLTNQSGGAISTLNFGGDDGVDTLQNTGTVGTLTFGGGADDDILVNHTGGTVNTLSFGGDDGVDGLQNDGDVGTLTFGGGADDDTLINNGSVTNLDFTGGADDDVLTNNGNVTTTLVFGGDGGVDTLSNRGAVASLTFTGGADDDILVNRIGGTVTTLNFGGDDGVDGLQNDGNVTTLTFGGGADDDTLINNGSVTNLDFTGGADDDVLNNNGSVVTSLTFGGDDGIDTLNNNGTVADLVFTGGSDDDALVNNGSITDLDFTGGADDDVLVNNGGTVGGISFGGDDGADTLQNSGNVGTLTFNGGADDDVLVNQSGGTVDSLTFGGDDGADALQNDGHVDSLTFNGGADDDLLINNGSDISTLHFGGDAGDDILLNTGSDIGTLDFTGGADDDVLQNDGGNVGTLNFGGDDRLDVLINNGSNVGRLTFGGGSDDDVLVNDGDDVGTLTFSGDAGDDMLIVRGSGTGLPGSAIVFTGGGGADAFQNDARGFASITFTGDDGADVLKNNASDISNLTFNGGADDDVLENNGTNVADLEVNGDDGADILISDGDGVGNLTFNGGADDDVLVNNGSDASTLEFNGDDGSDTLVNNGENTSGLTFGGGADDDTLINTGPGLTDLVFSGDAGSDRFWNQKTAVQSANLTFTGDDGADLLINDAGGVTDLTFDGGADDDGLQNNGGNVSGLTFNGGADDDTLINTGGAITDLVFRGDAGNDSFRQSGPNAGVVTFTGDEGDDLLINTGTVDSLTFGGGADDDTLQNDGGNVETLTFGGDDGADLLINNGPVTTLDFTGGADDDTLQNNGEVQTLTFGGGADDDTLINNADGVPVLVFNGDDRADTLINNGSDVGSLTFNGGADGDTFRTHGSGIGTIVFTGGPGTDGFHYNSTGAAGSSVTFDAGGGNDFFAWRGAADTLNFDGGGGDDLALILGSGDLTLGGGDGDDTIQFQSHPDAYVTVTETYSGADDTSSDTLDFSPYTGGPLDIDLRITTPQVQSPQFTIQFTVGLGVENILGTQFGDTILGNARNNIISGAEYSDGFAGPLAASRGDTQWVLLDFDTHTDAGEHIYTTDEQNQIVANIEDVFRGPDAGAPWFDVRVTLDTGEIPAGLEYATIWFNQTPEFGRPGGLASEIDPGNVNPGGSAVVQINGLLGGIITAADIAGEGNPEAYGHGMGCCCPACLAVGLSGSEPSIKADQMRISDAEIGSNKPAATSENFVRLSSKIGKHELGHLLGLRHGDAFGPIGLGLHDPPGVAGYKPAYTGPVGGVETFDHVGGSPGSIGSDRFNDLKDLFFGEREAIKLGYAFSNLADTLTTEISTPHNTHDTAQPVPLVTMAVPNTLSRGLNDAKDFFVQLQAINGRIDVDAGTGTSESDWYSFTGSAGELVNVDVLSNSVARFGDQADDYVDTIVRVWYVTGGTLTLVPYYDGVAVNDDIFEPTDSSIIDLVLPEDGTYYVEIDTFRRLPGDDGYEAAVALRDELTERRDDADTTNDLSEAEAQFLERLTDTLTDTDAGNYHLVMYRFDKASASDGIDIIKGNGGLDEVDGGPGDSYELVVDLGNSGSSDEGTAFTRTVVVDDRAASDWTGSTVDYGDGSGVQSLSVDAIGTFELNHIYGDNGTYTISVTIVDDIGQSLTETLDVTVDNQAPVPAIDSISSVRKEGTAIDFAGSATDAAGTNDTLTFHWDFGDGSAVATGASVAHTYADNGAYTVTLTVSDEDGGSTQITQEITVDNVAPTPAMDSISALRQEGTAIDFAGSATDPAGTNDTLTLVWDFGDGSGTVSGKTTSHIYVDNGTYTVTLTVSDEDGGSTEVTQDITVDNVAPTPAIDSISATRKEGTSIDFTGSATDPAATNDTLTYVWDFGDGSAAATGADVSHTYADNGTYTVTLTVSDEDGGSTSATQDITVDNVAPELTVDSDTIEVDLNGVATNAGTYADPGVDAVTLTASLGDITFANGTWNWSYDASSVQDESLTITITATDDDDGSVDVQFTVIVNLPPTLDVAAPVTAVRGQTVEFVLTTTDPNASDQAGEFTYVVDWGDGSVPETFTGPATLTAKHTYDTITEQNAPHQVSVTVTDQRGLSSAAITHSVEVLRWEIQDDPLHPGESVLFISGSTGSDIITVREGWCSDYIRLKVNEWENDIQVRATASDLVHRIAVYGQAGNDYIFISLNVSVPSLLDGGDGDDLLVGGYRSSVLVGGAGDDTLFGSFQRGLLIGGEGRDKLFGWNGSDLLIGGTTAFDNNRAALHALMDEWNSARSYSERRDNLMGTGTGERFNGEYFLKFNQGDASRNTVFDDNAEDKMWGGTNIDWYLANTDGDEESEMDKLFGAKWYEVVDDLDRE